MTSVLYDVPGPRARRRNVILGVVGLLIGLGVIGFIVYRFAVTGQFSARLWRTFAYPQVQSAFLDAALNTLRAFALASVLSVALGLVLAVGRLSDRRWISRPVGWITELFRAVPVLLLMGVVYYGLPSIGVQGITPYLAVVVGLTLYNGSVLAEVFRAGMQAIPRGQVEAGYAIGLRKSQVTSIVLLPQAVRLMLPVIISQLVVVMKDTALGFIVTYNEILFYAKYLGSQGQLGSPIIPAAIVAAVLYIGMCLILSGVAKLLEWRLNRSGRTGNTRAPARVPAGDGAAV
ncbi:amino acid ABC transporter permease [Tersicoccus solisilvae]|uniref:Amino acid ABC transporter permease n=1 Tax=Tersicoccus solisilvae TaxID=1882339 RepID=A0ABQ1PPQ8_9MICC|nr:amino acid ABC transporter permease [Tersicoccus solisilvae]GGD00760.1 amino acid ABC transporter permease [Tersicoccus solisilvae]